MILGFTGHRPAKLGGYGPSLLQDRVREQINRCLIVTSCTRAITGMALGVDTWVAEECLKRGTPFTAAIPFDRQEERWPSEAQDHYWNLIRKAERVEYISKGRYCDPALYQKRNEWIVNNCECLIAFWDGTPSGTGNCVAYAKRVGRKFEVIDPRELM